MTKRQISNQDLQEENVQSAINLAVIANDVSYIKKSVNDINCKLEKDYVTQDEFDPVRKVVYGLVSTILLAVIGALVGLVVMK